MMPEDNHHLKSVKKLNFSCPFCGEDLFSISCIGGEFEYITKTKLCLVLDYRGGPFEYCCHSFCYFICNKQKIEIDMELIARRYIKSNERVYCSDIDRVCYNIFKNLFSLIPINKGFEI